MSDSFAVLTYISKRRDFVDLMKKGKNQEKLEKPIPLKIGEKD